MTLNPSRLAVYARNPVAFRHDLMVDSDGDIVALGSVMDPWQDQDFRALDGGWLRCMGHRTSEGFSRGYLERARAHSKSSDIATMCVFATAMAPKKIIGIAAAADLDQGRLLLDCVRQLLLANPLLASVLEVQRNTVINARTGSELRVISGDSGSSFGALIDYLVCDELCHWPANGESLWHSLASTIAKRKRCHAVVISNAGLGMGESWQWQVRESARQADSWYFSPLEGPVASWISPKLLEEQRALLPPGPCRRLWLNEWCLNAGDALEEADIQAAITQDGPMSGAEPDVCFLGALDLSVRRDRSCFLAVAVNSETQRVRLAECYSWTPRGGQQVDLQAVERTILDAHHRFSLKSLSFDAYQAIHLTQRIKAHSLDLIEVPFVGKNLDTMASSLCQFFRERRIDLYDCEIISDLRKLIIVEKSFGLKLEAPRDRSGHADCAFALACVAPECVRVLTTNTQTYRGPWPGLGAGLRSNRTYGDRPIQRQPIVNFY